MPYYPFGKDDIVRNTVKTFPKNTFFIYGGVVYHNERPYISGSLSEGENLNHVPPGFVSLYEYNVDRTDQSDLIPGGTDFIRPFVTKGGYLTNLKTISKDSFFESFLFEI